MRLPLNTNMFLSIIDKVAIIFVCLGFAYTLNQILDVLAPYHGAPAYFKATMKPILAEVTSISTNAVKVSHLGLAEEKYVEANVFSLLCDYQHARKSFSEAVSESELATGKLTSTTFLFANAQARFEKESKQYDEALRLYHVLETTWKNSTISNINLDIRDEIADCHLLQNNLDEALQLYEENVAIAERLDARSDPMRSFERKLTLFGLGRCQNQAERYKDFAGTSYKLLELAKQDGNYKAEVVEALLRYSATQMWLTDGKDYSEVLWPLNQAYSRDPLNAEISFRFLYVCIWAHHFAPALKWFVMSIGCCLFTALMTSFLGIRKVKSDPLSESEIKTVQQR